MRPRQALVLGMVFLALEACESAPTVVRPSGGSEESEGTTPPSSRVEEPDHREIARKRLLRLLSGSAVALSTGRVEVDGNVLSCTPRADEDPTERGDPAEDLVEAFSVSERTVLVHVRVHWYWYSRAEIVVELTRTAEGWQPSTFGLWWCTDVVAIGPDGRQLIRWARPTSGEIRVDDGESRDDDHVRCSLRLVDGSDGEVTTIAARFEVPPGPLPDEPPFIVGRFIEDTHLSERW